MIAMLMDFFGVLGLADRLELHVNSIGDAGTRRVYSAKLVEYLAPHRPGLCGECQSRIDRNPLRVLDCKVPDCQPIIDNAPSILDSLSREAAEHFDSVRRYLDAMGIEHTVDPRLVRGLDYYVRTTFEVLTTELGAQNAVAGGGRYDGLIAQLGGSPDPGIGFAIGLERVVLLLGEEARGAAPVVLLIPLGEAALERLLPAARRARQAGVAVEVGYGLRKLPRELERANRLGAAWALIAGDNELARGEAVLREMRSGEQRHVPLGTLDEELVRLGAARNE
jgi:histidyl-tRNA synthetase